MFGIRQARTYFVRGAQKPLQPCDLVTERCVSDEAVSFGDGGLSVLQAGQDVKGVHIVDILDAKFVGC